MTKPIYVLNGPNLNLLGEREPEIYGRETLADVKARLQAALASKAGEPALDFRQTNTEGTLVDWIQEARLAASALILNAGAYTHTSIALHDALKACPIPIIEVHISNPAAREPFRQTNYVTPASTGAITGLGTLGYDLALQAAVTLIDKGNS